LIAINLGFFALSLSPILLLISASIGLSVSLIVIIRNKGSVPKALLCGVLTIIGTYAVFSLVIAAARSHTVLPNSNFMQLDGKEVKITDISQQQPTVVNLWASSCTPCIRLMPVLEEAEGRYKNVKFISLNQRESSETVQRFLQREGFNFEHVLLDRKGNVATNKGLFSLPVTLFFDAEGNLVHSLKGGISAESLEQSIAQYFQ
jgi:thiol-disulfide isomerase/thioredoxin